MGVGWCAGLITVGQADSATRLIVPLGVDSVGVVILCNGVCV